MKYDLRVRYKTLLYTEDSCLHENLCLHVDVFFVITRSCDFFQSHALIAKVHRVVKT